jgi:hypothetical protein
METKSKQEEQLEMLADIRNLMDRSSRFISLSGMSGVLAGLSALVGAGFLFLQHSQAAGKWVGQLDLQHSWVIVLVAGAVLATTLTGGYLLTRKEAKKQGQLMWDRTSQRMVMSLALPLAAGGLFCLILAWQGHAALLLPVTLLFYGMSLVSAAKFTLDDLRYLGYFEVVLGLLAAIWPAWGLAFWALGFGLLHIIYGIHMHLKYNR